MRVRRILVRNLRGVSERELPLLPDGEDSGVTIVEGRNETGKTSLGDALYALLGSKATSRAQLVRSLGTTGRDEATVVEADIETGPYRFTYTKHFNVGSKTELVLQAPAEERLAGDDAHEQVNVIISETMDRDLWEALRLRQASGLEQATLAGSTALAAALSRRAQLTAIRDREARLADAVRDDYLTYYTPRHRERAAYAAYAKAVAERKQDLSDIEGQHRALETDVERVASVQRQWPKLQAQLTEARAEAESAEQAEGGLVRLEAEIEKAELRLQTARSEADRAQAAQGGRRERVAELTVTRERLDTIDETRRDVTELAGVSQERLDAAGKQLRQLTEGRRVQAVLADRAESDTEHIQHLAELEDTEERLTRAEAARSALRDGQAVLTRIPVDDTALAELRDLAQGLALADARLATASPTVAFTAARAISLTVDGDEQVLDDGETIDRLVTGEVSMDIPDVGRITVRAGTDVNQVLGEREDAQAELREALDRAGVADLTAAEHARQERAAAEDAAHDAERVLAECLDGLELSELEDRLAASKVLVSAYVEARPSEPPLPADREEALRRRDDAKRALAKIDEDLERLRDEIERMRTEHEQRQQEIVRLDAERVEVERRREVVASELERERTDRSDEEVQEAAEQAAAAVEQIEQELADLRDALVEEDPVGVRERKDNCLAVLSDAEKRLREAERQIDRLDAGIQARGAEGLYTQLEAARAALTDAEREQRSAARRAAAARRLHKTLTKHRDLARERYAEPLRERVCEFGQLIYGDGFDVEFDEDLRMVRRRLDGLWLETEALSDGAKEQLALLARVACATLVSQDGSPGLLLIDDALGNTDPDRLREIGTVLRMAAQHCQIVIFTCYPDRYRHVGGALRVALD